MTFSNKSAHIFTRSGGCGAEKYIELLKPDYEITTDGTLIHSNDNCVYSSSLSMEKTNAIVTEILKQAPNSEITFASGKTVLWNSKHISESKNYIKRSILNMILQ